MLIMDFPLSIWELDLEIIIAYLFFPIMRASTQIEAFTMLQDGKVGINNSSPAYTLDVAGSGNFTGNLIVGGDLTVNGTTVIANVDTMEVEDPILTLGLASGNVVTDTNLDRGLALALNSNTTGFMGWILVQVFCSIEFWRYSR